MKNKYKPFFYDAERTPFLKVVLLTLVVIAAAILVGFQIPTVRQFIAEPVFAAGSLVFNSAKDLFAMSRMYHEPETPKKTWEPLELPDSQVLFAEDLESLSTITQEDPLADLRVTPTVSEYSRVAEWEYLDPNLNYAISKGDEPVEETSVIHLIPPVFERADLYNEGPAILSAALRYWNKVENQYEIAARIHPDSLDPFTNLSELKSYTEERYPDLSTLIRINGDKDLLISILQQQVPVIIPAEARSSFSFWPKDDRFIMRYFLIHGYDSTTGKFSYQDTLYGNTLEITADELLSIWYPFQRTYMIIYPTDLDEGIRSALAENYFEELNLQKAEAKFRTDSENLPQNAFAQYNYGTVLHRTGDDGGAWESYQKSLSISLPQRFVNYQTDILETALYLGYADDIDELIDPVLQRNSHDEILTVYRGWAFVLRGQQKEGAEQFEKAQKINPKNETVLYALRYKETMMQF